MGSRFERKKKWHPKSRSGCYTCRKRRIKCDEAKPSCQNCAKNKMICDGYRDSHGFKFISESASERLPTDSVNTVSKHSHVSIQPAIAQRPNTRHENERQLRPLQHVLAGGKLDPFNVFCVESAPSDQCIFDHAIHKQWPMFSLSQAPNELAVVKQNVMSYAIYNPVSYYALLYAGACHRNFWQRGITRSSEPNAELLQLKIQAISALRLAIERFRADELEDLVIATLLLAVFDAGDKVRRRPHGKVQGRKSLIHALDAEFYVLLDVEWEHLKMFYHVLDKYGGVLSLRPGPLQTSAILYDVLNAFVHLTPPLINTVLPLTETLKMRTWLQDDAARLLRLQIGHGFSAVHCAMLDHSSCSILQQIVRGFLDMIVDLDQLQRSRSMKFKTEHPSESTIIWIRSMLLHDLLRLPETLPSNQGGMKEELPALIYEMSRLSCLLFCQIWGFPDCNPERRQAQKLVYRLLPLLSRATGGEMSRRLCNVLPEFYTWILVLGFMLAYENFDDFEDEGCMTALAPFWAHSVIKPQREAWPIVRTTLSGFFWRWPYCDVTGKEAWDHACNLFNKSRAPAKPDVMAYLAAYRVVSHLCGSCNGAS